MSAIIQRLFYNSRHRIDVQQSVETFNLITLMLWSSIHTFSNKILQIINQSPFKAPQSLLLPSTFPCSLFSNPLFSVFNAPATLNGLWLSIYTVIISSLLPAHFQFYLLCMPTYRNPLVQ